MPVTQRAVLVFVGTILLTAGACVKKPSSFISPPPGQMTGSHIIFADSTYAGDNSFSFGFVPQESSIYHSFWLHNGCADTLRIVSVRPG